MPPFTVQKTAYYGPKDGLLRRNMLPFATAPAAPPHYAHVEIAKNEGVCFCRLAVKRYFCRKVSSCQLNKHENQYD